MNNLRQQEVPYPQAPPLAGSDFEALKNLNLLDAKTHLFAQAWQAGYTGQGEVGSVLDGGTDSRGCTRSSSARSTSRATSSTCRSRRISARRRSTLRKAR